MEITFQCICRKVLAISTPNQKDLADAVRVVGWHVVDVPGSAPGDVLPFARCSERCDRVAARLDALRVKSFETGSYDYKEEARIWRETP